MKKITNLKDNPLLSEVYKDAVSKSEEVISLSIVDCLVDFAEDAWKKKVEGLLQEIHKYPRDVVLFDVTIQGLEYVVAGVSDEEILLFLTEDYWKSGEESNKAFERYISILGVFLLKEEYSPSMVQQIVLQEFIIRNQFYMGSEV